MSDKGWSKTDFNEGEGVFRENNCVHAGGVKHCLIISISTGSDDASDYVMGEPGPNQGQGGGGGGGGWTIAIKLCQGLNFPHCSSII